MLQGETNGSNLSPGTLDKRRGLHGISRDEGRRLHNYGMENLLWQVREGRTAPCPERAAAENCNPIQTSGIRDPRGLRLVIGIPESCMKINEKFEEYLKTIDCKVFSSKAKYLIGKKDDSRCISLIFTLRASRRLSSAALLRARSNSLRLRP